MGWRQAYRTFQDVRAVPEQMLSTVEVPLTIAALVPVLVLEHLDDPFVAVRKFPARVKDAPGSVVAFDFDEVRPEQQDRVRHHVDLPSDERLQRLPTGHATPE